jgi:TonB family protein
MNFLVLIEKYQNAIIGALIVHVLIFVWLNVQNVSFYVIKPKEKIVATLDFTEKLIESTAESRINNSLIEDVELTNSASNYDQKKEISASQKEYISQEVIDEVKNYEKKQFNDFGKDNPTIKEKAKVQEIVAGNEIVNKSLGKTSNATAKYFCEDRNMRVQQIPSYMCNETGTVRLNIKVSPKGEVTDCKIDNALTNTSNSCLIKNALNYAKNWKFNQDFSKTQKQIGWIEFIYISQ